MIQTTPPHQDLREMEGVGEVIAAVVLLIAVLILIPNKLMTKFNAYLDRKGDISMKS